MTKRKLLKHIVLPAAALLLAAAAGICIWAATRPDYPPVVRLWGALYFEVKYHNYLTGEYFSTRNVEDTQYIYPVEPELRVTDICSPKALPESNCAANRAELLENQIILTQKTPTESFPQLLPRAIVLYDEEAHTLGRFRLYDPHNRADAESVLNGQSYLSLIPLGPAAAEVMDYYSFAPASGRFTSCWLMESSSSLYAGRHPICETLPEGGTVNEAFLNKPLYKTPYSDDLIIELSPGEYYYLPVADDGGFAGIHHTYGMVTAAGEVYRVEPYVYTAEQINFFHEKYQWVPTEDIVTDATWKANIGSRIWKG